MCCFGTEPVPVGVEEEREREREREKKREREREQRREGVRSQPHGELQISCTKQTALQAMRCARSITSTRVAEEVEEQQEDLQVLLSNP